MIKTYPVKITDHLGMYMPYLRDSHYMVISSLERGNEALKAQVAEQCLKTLERKYYPLLKQTLHDYDFVLKTENPVVSETTRQYSAMVINYILRCSFALYFSTPEDQTRFLLANPFNVPQDWMTTK